MRSLMHDFARLETSIENVDKPLLEQKYVIDNIIGNIVIMLPVNQI